MDIKEIWKDTLEIVKLSVSPAIFKTWFSQTHISSTQDLGERMIIEIGCPTSFAKNTIEARYFGLIQDSLNKVTDKKCDLVFLVKENPDKESVKAEEDSPLFSDETKSEGFISKPRHSRSL